MPEAALVVWEAKKPENPEDPLPQARWYAERLGAPLYATCNGQQLAVYRAEDHALQFDVPTLDRLEERWDELERLLHRAVLLERYPGRRLPPETEVRAAGLERSYRVHIQERLEQIQVLNWHEGVQLRRVYVPTRLARVAERFVPADDEQVARPGLQMLPRGRDARLVDDVIREHRRFVVVGDVGAGKTTMLRHLTLELAAGNHPSLEQVIPVYIPLNELFKERQQHEARPIEEYSFAYFERDLERLEVPLGDRWLRGWLEQGRVALLRDGLDEVTGFAASAEGSPHRPLAAMGDETVYEVARRWLTQPEHAKDALDLLAEYWPDDLLDYAGPEAVVCAFIANKGITRFDLIDRAAHVLESWWRRALVQADPCAHRELLTALLNAGVAEAVPEFCTQATGLDELGRLTSIGVQTLVASAAGRTFALGVLSEDAGNEPASAASFIAFLPSTEPELLMAGLSWCLRQAQQKGERVDFMWALRHIANSLDLFVYRDPSGELRYRPREWLPRVLPIVSSRWAGCAGAPTSGHVDPQAEAEGRAGHPLIHHHMPAGTART